MTTVSALLPIVKSTPATPRQKSAHGKRVGSFYDALASFGVVGNQGRQAVKSQYNNGAQSLAETSDTFRDTEAFTTFDGSPVRPTKSHDETEGTPAERLAATITEALTGFGVAVEVGDRSELEHMQPEGIKELDRNVMSDSPKAVMHDGGAVGRSKSLGETGGSLVERLAAVIAGVLAGFRVVSESGGRMELQPLSRTVGDEGGGSATEEAIGAATRDVLAMRRSRSLGGGTGAPVERLAAAQSAMLVQGDTTVEGHEDGESKPLVLAVMGDLGRDAVGKADVEAADESLTVRQAERSSEVGNDLVERSTTAIADVAAGSGRVAEARGFGELQQALQVVTAENDRGRTGAAIRAATNDELAMKPVELSGGREVLPLSRLESPGENGGTLDQPLIAAIADVLKEYGIAVETSNHSELRPGSSKAQSVRRAGFVKSDYGVMGETVTTRFSQPTGDSSGSLVGRSATAIAEVLTERGVGAKGEQQSESRVAAARAVSQGMVDGPAVVDAQPLPLSEFRAPPIYTGSTIDSTDLAEPGPVQAGNPSSVTGSQTIPRPEWVSLQVPDGNGGMARIRVTVRGDRVRVTIVHDNEQVGQNLRSNLSDLRSALAGKGFGESRLVVQRSMSLDGNLPILTAYRDKPGSAAPMATFSPDRDWSSSHDNGRRSHGDPAEQREPSHQQSRRRRER